MVILINRETQCPVGERFASRLVVQCLGFVYKSMPKGYYQRSSEQKEKLKKQLTNYREKAIKNASLKNLGNKYCVGRILSEETKRKIGNANLRIDSGYKAIHLWLINNYGRPKKCYFCGRGNKSIFKKNYIHYALKINKKHEHNINNYLTLCVLCHRNYDLNNKKYVNTK